MKKLIYTTIILFSLFDLLAQDTITNNEKYFKNDASYNRSGLYYNGFRLKHKEIIYTNSYFLLNNLGIGYKNIFEINTAFTLIPISGEKGIGMLPLILFIPKIGCDFGELHHMSASFIYTPIVTDKQLLRNKQIAYTFGTTTKNIGILYSNDELINQKCAFIYLQTSFKLSKMIKVGMEHIMYTNYDEVNSTELGKSFNKKPSSEYLIPTNLMLRISPNKIQTFCIGYFTQLYYSNKPILYLSLNVRMNKLK